MKPLGLIVALSFAMGVLLYDCAIGAPGNRLSPGQEEFLQGQLESVLGPIAEMQAHKRAQTATVVWVFVKVKPQGLSLWLLAEKRGATRWCILSGYEDDGGLMIVPELIGPLGECA